ncbi:hypothetical protein [Cupriavidus basilensis]
MATTSTRFYLRVPSERTGRSVLPAPSKRRAYACCEALVATGWVFSSQAPTDRKSTTGAGMKGKSILSPAEAMRIRELLREVRSADRDEQKKLRDRLQIDVSVYISDFTRSNVGFTVDDFDSLAG